MPRPRFLKLDPARRVQILERAAQEFSDHGYRHASLNRVIEALGLSKGLFYYYFDDKADLFAAVIRMVWETVLPDDLFDPARLDADNFWSTLRAFLLQSHARVREKPWLVGLARLLMAPAYDADFDPVVAAELRQAQGWARSLLQRGQQLGAVRTDVPLELLTDVLSAADQASDRWWLARWDQLTPEQREHLAEGTFDLWRRIAEPGRAPSGAQGEGR